MFLASSNLPIVVGLDFDHVLVQDGRDYPEPPAVAGLVEDHIINFRLQGMAVTLGDITFSDLVFDAFRLQVIKNRDL